tara:strand:+ start:4996 stop:5328 length:333 start_codon:yes stop_codon:yes gene_type:complete
MSRYKKRRKAINGDDTYRNLFDIRGVKSVEQYRTLAKDVYEQEVYDSIDVVEHPWRFGDMYWRLSARYYGDPQYWWVIASFNKRPTEHLNKIGDIIEIPINLADALQVVE